MDFGKLKQEIVWGCTLCTTTNNLLADFSKGAQGPRAYRVVKSHKNPNIVEAFV